MILILFIHSTVIYVVAILSPNLDSLRCMANLFRMRFSVYNFMPTMVNDTGRTVAGTCAYDLELSPALK